MKIIFALTPLLLALSACGSDAPPPPREEDRALQDAIQQVNGLELNSRKEVDQFLTGDTDLHSVMMALEKADVSFQLMMQVRNKIVSAYQEIMKTQV